MAHFIPLIACCAATYHVITFPSYGEWLVFAILGSTLPIFQMSMNGVWHYGILNYAVAVCHAEIEQPNQDLSLRVELVQSMCVVNILWSYLLFSSGAAFLSFLTCYWSTCHNYTLQLFTVTIKENYVGVSSTSHIASLSRLFSLQCSVASGPASNRLSRSRTWQSTRTESQIIAQRRYALPLLAEIFDPFRTPYINEDNFHTWIRGR